MDNYELNYIILSNSNIIRDVITDVVNTTPIYREKVEQKLISNEILDALTEVSTLITGTSSGQKRATLESTLWLKHYDEDYGNKTPAELLRQFGKTVIDNKYNITKMESLVHIIEEHFKDKFSISLRSSASDIMIRSKTILESRLKKHRI